MSTDNLSTYRDFRVRCAKISRTLRWLKENNNYYADIVIDNKILQSLSNNDFVCNRLKKIKIMKT